MIFVLSNFLLLDLGHQFGQRLAGGGLSATERALDLYGVVRERVATCVHSEAPCSRTDRPLCHRACPPCHGPTLAEL